MTAGLLGVGSRAHLRARRRCLRRARRHRPAQPGARPAGARRCWAGCTAAGSGRSGLMAEQNTLRNPRRTAATASALMIGVVARDDDGRARGVGQGQPRQDPGRGHHRRLRREQPLGTAVLGPVANDIEQVPGVADVARVRAALLQVDGDRDFATAVDPAAITAVARPEVSTGSLADLDATSAAVSTGFAQDNGLAVGSTDHRSATPARRPRWTSSPTYVADSVLGVGRHHVARRVRRDRGRRRRTARSTSSPSRAPTRRRSHAGPRRRGRRPADGQRQGPGRLRRRAARSRSTGCSSSSTPCSASRWSSRCSASSTRWRCRSSSGSARSGCCAPSA